MKVFDPRTSKWVQPTDLNVGANLKKGKPISLFLLSKCNPMMFERKNYCSFLVSKSVEIGIFLTKTKGGIL